MPQQARIGDASNNMLRLRMTFTLTFTLRTTTRLTLLAANSRSSHARSMRRDEPNEPVDHQSEDENTHDEEFKSCQRLKGMRHDSNK